MTPSEDMRSSEAQVKVILLDLEEYEKLIKKVADLEKRKKDDDEYIAELERIVDSRQKRRGIRK